MRYDRGNSPKYWDELWSSPKRRVEVYSMRRALYHMKKLKPKSILDVGCGNGKLLYYAKKYGYCYGIDISKVAIDWMKEKYGVDGAVMSVYDVDKLDRKFDFIVANHILEHLKDDAEFVKKCKKIMDKNGHFFCAVPNNMSHPDETEEHCQMYNWQSLESLLTGVFGNADMSLLGNHLIGLCKN